MPSSAWDPDQLIGNYRHDTRRRRADHALYMLKRVASLVKPIMRRRNYTVGTLAEFYPSHPGLLGMNTNQGQKIQIRLRYAGDADQFLPIEEITDTMLHELAHNTFGPHDEKFHRLWDQLRDELEVLIRKGYSGEGLLGKGERLGGKKIPLHEARRRARAAAEERRKRNAGSGQRLGGFGILRGSDVRSVIAAAAERRSRVQKGCVMDPDQVREVVRDEEAEKGNFTTTAADKEDENEAVMMQAYIELIEEEENATLGTDHARVSASNPSGPRAALPENVQARSLLEQQKSIEQDILKQKKTTTTSRSESSLPQKRSPPSSPSVPHRSKAKPIQQQPEAVPDTWTCEVCTLVNPIQYLACDACTVERPAHVAETLSLIASLTSPDTSHTSRPTSARPYEAPISKPPGSSKSTKTSQNTAKKSTHSVLKPRLTSAENYKRFATESADKVASRPVGWECRHCNNFMESEWWTCSACGRMKESS